jgi:hypothetical protein
MTVHDVLAALDTLEDGELHVVMTRAQALLLDHPGPTGGGSALAVEIVERQEGRLRSSLPWARRSPLPWALWCP